MNVLIAMDSFKGCLSSLEAGNAIKEGILEVDPFANIQLCPLADGGEGTVDAVCCGSKAEIVSVRVTGPTGDPVLSKYGILEDGTAVIEIAAAAGLTLIPDEKRDPCFTTTYGVGEMIRDAINRGCREFIVGLGGSGSNDGGAGMLLALGWELRNSQNLRIPYGAIGLRDLCTIEDKNVDPQLSECHFRMACDVTNPLLGSSGCSAIFGPQKGATETMVTEMDEWLTTYCEAVQRHFPTADPNYPGSGAAGGLGFAFHNFLGGVMESGAELVGQIHKLDDKIRESDLIITGEGRLDGQSAMGKGPMYIARLGKKFGKTTVALAGTIGEGAELCLKEGLCAYFPISPENMPLDEAMRPMVAYENLKQKIKQVYFLCSKA